MKKTKQNGPKKKSSNQPHLPRAQQQQQQQPARQQQRIALLDSLDDLNDSKIRLEACAAIAAKFEPSDVRDDAADEIAVQGVEAHKNKQKKDAETKFKMRKEIVKLGRDGMFKSLVRLITDVDFLVRLNAIGALRNLGLTGGDKALVLMQQEDAWTALSQGIATTLANQQETEEVKYTVLKESLRLMDLLCEWSPAIAEKRLPDTFEVLASCLRHTNRDVVEACAKLIWVASEDNSALAKVLVSTEAGKQVGIVLEELITSKLTSIPNPHVVAAAYSVGILLNVAVVCQHSELAKLASRWFASCGNLLSEASLPNVTVSDVVIQDAINFEAEDMAEDGQAIVESELLRQWLDLTQAQRLVFDCFGDLLRKVGKAKEEVNGKSNPYWATSIMPLEVGGLLPSSLMFSCFMWSGENTGPKTLTLSVAALQQSAAECASAAIDAFSVVDANLLREAWSRSNQVLFSTCFQGLQHVDVSDRLTAYAQLLSSLARRSQTPLSINGADVSKILADCQADEVRALFGNVLGRLVHLDLSQLQAVSTILLEAIVTEKALMVSCEHVDAVIDLFSEDDRQPLFDSLNGLRVFIEFARTFESRFTELKRQEEAQVDDELCERMFEVKANVDAFIDWRKGGK